MKLPRMQKSLIVISYVGIAVAFSTGVLQDGPIARALDLGNPDGIRDQAVPVQEGPTAGSLGAPVEIPQESLEASPEILGAQDVPTQSETIVNFDKDFLIKERVEPWKAGFQDRLDVPAKISPLAAKNILNGIVSAGSRLVAVGIRGHIIYSDDKGKSWTQSKVPLSSDLTAVFFPSPKHGWAVGHDGVVLNSADGGITWTKQLDGYEACRIMNKYYKTHPVSETSPDPEKIRSDIQYMIKQGPVYPFLDVWFENESVGFIVGAFNLIFRTENGGKSWEPWFDRTENPFSYHLYSIRCNGKDVYISGEQGLLMKLDHRAKRLRAQKTPYNGTFFGIVGKPGAVVAYGMGGNIFHSENGGVSWKRAGIDGVTISDDRSTPAYRRLQESSVAEVPPTILGGAVRNDGSIILVDQGGKAMISKDTGKTFTTLKQEGPPIPMHAVTVADDTTLATAGWFGIKMLKIR